jgi:hypothetical protein
MLTAAAASCSDRPVGAGRTAIIVWRVDIMMLNKVWTEDHAGSEACLVESVSAVAAIA